MARQASVFKFTGRIGDLSFYKMNGEYFVRQAGGPSRDYIRKSPACARVRENISEFVACSASGRRLRQSLACYFTANDNYLYRRVTAIMSKLKGFDTRSVRGSRTPAKALHNQNARDFLKGFSFNLAPVPGFLLDEITVSSKDEIAIRNLAALRRIFPKGAHTAFIKAGVLALDLSCPGSQFIEYTTVQLDHKDLAPVILNPRNTVGSGDPRFYILQVRLFDKNGNVFRNGNADLLFILRIRLHKIAPKSAGAPLEFPSTAELKRTSSYAPVFSVPVTRVGHNTSAFLPSSLNPP